MSSMKWVKQVTISSMECPDCHKTFPIARRKSKPREKGHIKDLWCPFCQDVKKHVEHRAFDFN